MIKYYHPHVDNYQYGRIWCYIDEYYLIKEGWIHCSDYRENPEDSYYKAAGYTREDYISKRKSFKDKNMFESLEKAKEELKRQLDGFYKKECLELLKAYNKVANDLGLVNG
jgi:hypothetical protein